MFNFKKNKKNKNKKISELTQGVEKKKLKPEEKKKSRLGPKTTAGLKFLRILIYTILIGIMVIGIFQIVRSKRPVIKKEVYQVEQAASVNEKSQTFAKSFVKEYLTLGTNETNTDYQKRVSSYINTGIYIGRPTYSSGSMEVLDVMVWETKEIDENTSDIIVKSEVLITTDKEIENYKDEVEYEKIEKEIFVSVPIYTRDNQVIVNDYPSFVRKQNKLDANVNVFSNDNRTSDKIREEIKEFSINFFDIYTSGTKGQIRNFFKENHYQEEYNGLGGEFSFEDVEELQTYEENDKIKAVVLIKISQSVINTPFYQRYLLELEKQEDRWLITNIKNRGL